MTRLAVAACAVVLTACGGSLDTSAPTSSSYVPWLPLAPAHQYVSTPLASPASAPPVPAGTLACRGAQLEGVAAAGGAAMSNVNMPLLFRNHSSTDCFVEGYPSVTVVGVGGRVLAASSGTKSQGTYFADDAVAKVMMLHGTAALPGPEARTNGSLGQAYMNFSWYDCATPRAMRLAVDLPDGGGRFWMPFAVSGDASPACNGGQNYIATSRGPFSAAGVSWAPSLGYIAAEITIDAPQTAARGSQVIYFVTIRNGSDRDYFMLPCADYYVSLVKQHLATYQLNCSSVGQIAPTGIATFEMRVEIPRLINPGGSEILWCLDDGRTGMTCGHTAIQIT